MDEERFWVGEEPCWVLTVGSGVWRGVRGCMGRWCGVGIVRWGGCRGRARWTVRDVLWRVRCELLGINGGLWGGGMCGDEVPKNGGVGWCWAVDVVLSWLCAFRL